ncbi:MAG: MarR family winged helix-turn-helix transcriptional regulator [Verrucomicrobia bacterium]|nr:MarR family winged helix-turn-helix transcriptional regulator [Verrucomicrobiota bacterium]
MNSKPETAPVDSPVRRRLPPLLRRAWYGLNQAFRRRIAHTGLTPDQFTVMRILQECDPEGITQRELTRLMSSDPNTVASLLERMETAGWVERRPHEKDRRAHRIRLQKRGQGKYSEARRIALALQADVLEVLPENKREEFLGHLKLVADACRESAELVSKQPKSKTPESRAKHDTSTPDATAPIVADLP